MHAIKRTLLAGTFVVGLTGMALAEAAPDGVRGNVECFGGPWYVCQPGQVFTQAPAFASFETESGLEGAALASATIEDDDEAAFASAAIEDDEDGAGPGLMLGREAEDD
jgi:hypothetical protein